MWVYRIVSSTKSLSTLIASNKIINVLTPQRSFHIYNCCLNSNISTNWKQILSGKTFDGLLLFQSLRCSSSKILEKKNSKRNQRWKSIESPLQTINGQYRATKLKETKRKVTAKINELKENIWTIPNALTVTRMVATPFLGYLVLQEHYLASLGIFLAAGATDVIDGYIARTYPNQKSMIGSFLDPAADKFLIATLFLTLTVNRLIPTPLTVLIISRDICLMLAGFYIRWVSLPPPKTIWRYFDATHATASLSPTFISKANTGVQVAAIALSLAAPIFGYVDHYLLQIIWYVTGVSTVLSAGSYLYCKNTYSLAAFSKKMSKGS